MNASPLSQLRIVVLAAGYSRRLGTPKALARMHGASLLRRTALMLTKLVRSQLIVIVPPRAARLRVELRRIPAVLCANSRRSEGLASSVRLGLSRAKFSAGVLIVPVDLAALERRDLRRLIARWQAARRRVAARRIGTLDGIHGDARGDARGGTPVILPKGLFAAAAGSKGEIGLRDMIARLAPEQRILIDLPSAAFDVDTAEDLTRARRNWSATAVRGRP
ncbi:MAG: NTP transferase domain-containing protein [Steroidobacteraceae bacterium]|jgi:molybdenum cofactor cytidylyltransferase